MNRLILTAALALGMGAYAAVPDGYYDSLEGKRGDELVAAIKALSDGHVRITYNTKTWGAFEKTDVRIVGGREVWWDMYSNNIVYLPDHAALNIEHSVANSWWGGKSGSADAYADLFHLNPSDQNANNRKSSYPPGEVALADVLDNGLLLIGDPVDGQGGGAANVFEPADIYKGDFARAYFYIFTAYPDISWDEKSAFIYDADKKLQPWAAEVLLKWHRMDPVDSKELERNEQVSLLQKNRNPFIDHPELAEFLWGNRSGESCSLSEPAVATNRPAAPLFKDSRMVGVDTYVHRWWNGYNLDIECGEGTLMLSIDGGDYYTPASAVEVDPAFNMGESHSYRAFVRNNVNGMLLDSPVATLTLQALNPDVTNYSLARWERVANGEIGDLSKGEYLILSQNTLHAMSTDGGTATTAFMNSAGFVEFSNTGRVVEVPIDAAIVTFGNLGNGKYRLVVNDTESNYVGSWKATDKNKMALGDEYTPGTPSLNENDEFIFTFDEYGSLQFNKSQPRFLNYESTQGPVYLYRFLDFEQESGVESVIPSIPWGVGVDGNDIIVDSATRIFDLNGRPVRGEGLAPGIYIVVGEKTHKVVIGK